MNDASALARQRPLLIWPAAGAAGDELGSLATPATIGLCPLASNGYVLTLAAESRYGAIPMEAEQDSVAISRPRRWSKPMDASMNDADVCWLRSREPFASMDPKSFPPALPLEGILRNDCRIQRCEPGQIVVREGDYGHSAFLVLAGSVHVVVDALSPEQLGRTPREQPTWPETIRRYLFPSGSRETRKPHEVTTHSGCVDRSSSIREVDDRPAVFLQDFDIVLHDHQTVSLGPGELFGEVAAMFRTPRTATVVSDTESTLLEIRWQGLRNLRLDARFAQTLDTHYRQHWLAIHLRQLPLLQQLPESSLARVVASTELRSFGRTDWHADYGKTRTLPADQQIESEPLVVAEGRVPTDLVVIRSGFGRVSQQHEQSHRTTAYLGKGHVFALDELAYNALRPIDSPPRASPQSLRAVGFLDALFIPAETFAQEILPHVRRSELPASAASLLLQPETARRDRPEVPDSAAEPSAPAGLLEFIVQHRMNNGRQAMVIDLHRCTRCDDCVQACASVHDGKARFARQGVAHGRLQIVQACMHCSDPVCMIGCPTGAIVRDRNTGIVEIHEPICVGCGTCVAGCPYENIRMAEVFDPQGRPYRDLHSGQPITKPIKCDACSNQATGPACVAACPHDALVRIDLTQSKPLRQWLDRRS